MKIKIPRISNPNELVEVEYIDEGNVSNPKEFVSKFIIDGKILLNICQSAGNFTRYKSDCEFLKKNDLCLEKAVFK